MMVENRPYVLSVAGFDPSGGAGVLADIKTFEQLHVQGLAVVTANTIQSDMRFESPNWINPDQINDQLKVLLDRFPISAVKIGLIENFRILDDVIDLIKSYSKEAPIILDPVLSATAGFVFHDERLQEIAQVFSKIDVITPNHVEYQKLMQKDLEMPKSYIKSVEVTDHAITDMLYLPDLGEVTYKTVKLNHPEKHGTGCILSSAIAAQVARGHSLIIACENARQYTMNVIKSNETKLGYHS